MRPKVSIIVPIYNVEPYLERCLESLISQLLKEIEIIAVNDGSTDNSSEILNRYAAMDERIIPIHQMNSGVSSARNRGIRLARGEYIGFVDPDDWADAQMYEHMYREAVLEDADIVMCTYTREFGTHSKEKKFELSDKVRYMGSDTIKLQVMRRLVGPLKEEIANPEYLDAWGTVWSKIYRAEIIKDNQLTFVDLSVIGTNEDSLFNIHAFYHANSFVFLNQPYYHYWRVNVGSVTSGYKPNLVNQWFVLYSMIENFLHDKNMAAEFYSALHNRICLNTLGLGLNTVSKANKASTISKYKKLDSILNDQRIQQSFRNFETSHCPKVWRTFYSCAKYRFVVGYYALLLAIEWLRTARR